MTLQHYYILARLSRDKQSLKRMGFSKLSKSKYLVRQSVEGWGADLFYFDKLITTLTSIMGHFSKHKERDEEEQMTIVASKLFVLRDLNQRKRRVY